MAGMIAEQKGFHEGRTRKGRDDTLIRLGLVMTEVAEAMQVIKRTGDVSKPEFAEELADILIRVGDLAYLTDVDLEAAVLGKLNKNMDRPHMYGTPKEGGDE